jgi:hypothetical protein
VPTPILTNADEFDVFAGKLLRRYAFVNQKNIAAFAEAFAHHLKAHTIPRDPFLLLPMLGIKLQPEALSRASRAVWVRTDGIYAVHYSRYEKRAAARFSLWHEAFEMLAQHPHFPSLLDEYWQERLADVFAACVLMPKTAVCQEAARFATNGEGLVAVLADRFAVSATAMRRRLREVAPAGLARGLSQGFQGRYIGS